MKKLGIANNKEYLSSFPQDGQALKMLGYKLPENLRGNFNMMQKNVTDFILKNSPQGKGNVWPPPLYNRIRSMDIHTFMRMMQDADIVDEFGDAPDAY